MFQFSIQLIEVLVLMWLIIYVCIINENVCINLKKFVNTLFQEMWQDLFHVHISWNNFLLFEKKLCFIYIYIYEDNLYII